MHLYRTLLRRLHVSFGDFPVRDWFWLRVPTVQKPAEFLAVMGLGLEAGNLDHAARFADKLREVGDEEGAALQEQIGEEEIGHVRFAADWFRRFTGGLDFDEWHRHLPPPLSPRLMRGLPLNRGHRERAGFSAGFLDRLAEW